MSSSAESRFRIVRCRAWTLNHGNGKFIVHEYYVFGNFYPWGRALLRSLQRRSCTLLWTEFSGAGRCHEPQCARPVVARSYGSSRSSTAPQGQGGQLAGSSTGSDWKTILKYRQAKGRIDFPGPAGNVDIRICSWWSCDHSWTASTGLAIQIYARNEQGQASGGGQFCGVKNLRLDSGPIDPGF